MNLKYALRSEDTEQINVIAWAEWNQKNVSGTEMAVSCPQPERDAVRSRNREIKADGCKVRCV